MTENLKKFLEYVAQNPEAREKANALQTESEEAVIATALAFAKEHGFNLTEADFASPEVELSERELAEVSGGTAPGTGPDTGGCFCLVGGGGGGTQTDGDIYGCACVAYGQGGDGDAADFTCFCVGYGEGNVSEPTNSLI